MNRKEDLNLMSKLKHQMKSMKKTLEQ